MRGAGRAGVVLAIIGIASACDLVGPSRREFLIHVDSAVAPATTSPNASLQLLVFGPIGPNLCYSFKEFRISRGSGSAEVSVVGEHADVLCGQMPVYLTGQPLIIGPPIADPFTVQFHQPDGSRLISTVRAR